MSSASSASSAYAAKIAATRSGSRSRSLYVGTTMDSGGGSVERSITRRPFYEQGCAREQGGVARGRGGAGGRGGGGRAACALSRLRSAVEPVGRRRLARRGGVGAQRAQPRALRILVRRRR